MPIRTIILNARIHVKQLVVKVVEDGYRIAVFKEVALRTFGLMFATKIYQLKGAQVHD